MELEKRQERTAKEEIDASIAESFDKAVKEMSSPETEEVIGKRNRKVVMVKKVILNTPEDDKRAGDFLMRVGSVIYTDKELEYIVPEDSIEKLKEALDIEFRVEPLSTGK